jgi:hypothetical protein
MAGAAGAALDWAGWTTAIGTVALVAATAALAWLTWLLARATSRPSLIATIETNGWAFQFVDLHLVNEGNASAFDIQVEFDPALPAKEEGMTVGSFSNVSVLRAGQHLTTNLGRNTVVIDKVFQVTISWRARPNAKRESMTYTLDMSFLRGITQLGGGDPTYTLAQEIKKIREQWEGVAAGRKRISTDTYTSADRNDEEQERERWIQEMQGEQNPPDPKPQIGSADRPVEGLLRRSVAWIVKTCSRS